MRSVGVCVHLPTKGRPAAHVAVIDGTWGSATEVSSFELTSNKDDLATILHELEGGLRSRLSGLKADRVAIRRADLQRASRKEGPKILLLAEGALAAAARAEVNDVLLLNGKELADRSPASSKDDLDARAAAELPDYPQEAAAAALAGLAP